MKHTTTVTIEQDLLRLAQLNNINISQFLNDALKEHLAQFDDPELSKITQAIQDLTDRIQILECRRQSIATENLNKRAWKKAIMKHDAFPNWKKAYIEAKHTNDQTAYMALLSEIIKKLGLPSDRLPSILDDVMSHLTS